MPSSAMPIKSSTADASLSVAWVCRACISASVQGAHHSAVCGVSKVHSVMAIPPSLQGGVKVQSRPPNLYVFINFINWHYLKLGFFFAQSDDFHVYTNAT